MSCKHIFHVDCLLSKIKKRWPGPRIVFNFLECPSCKKTIDAPHCKLINEEMADVLKLQENIIKKAIERAKFEELHKLPRLQ